MKRLMLFLAAALLTAQAVAVPLNNKPPFVPLHSAYSSAVNDNFYTVDLQQLQQATTIHGYRNTGAVAYLEAKQQPNTRPFKRFYKGLPQRNHFYTADASEEALVLSMGWVFERVEGYIYSTRVPGSVPLYRVNRFNPQTSDLVHKYTRSYSEVNTLRGQGWGYDGIAGYVYAGSYPHVSNGWVAGLRCPSSTPGRCWDGAQPANHRDYYFPHRLVPSTPRPAGYTRQRISLTFTTPDFFGGTGHLIFGGHGTLNVGRPHVDNVCPNGVTAPNCSWHRALGVIIYGQTCRRCGGTQIGQEAWWASGNHVVPPTQSYGDLRNNRQYRMVMTVTDSGHLSYTIRDLGTNALMAVGNWHAAGVYPDYSPFPSDLTGYFFGHATDNQSDFTFYVTNASVHWLP